MNELLAGYQGYIFAGLWLIIAIYMLYQSFKSSKIFLLVSLLFFFMGGWYLTNELIETNLFENPYVWIFRGICIAILAIIIIFMYINRKRILELAEKEQEAKNNNK